MYKLTNSDGYVIVVKEYQENHIEMNRVTSTIYQKKKYRIWAVSYKINHPKNHRVSQTLYEHKTAISKLLGI